MMDDDDNDDDDDDGGDDGDDVWWISRVEPPPTPTKASKGPLVLANAMTSRNELSVGSTLTLLYTL